MKKYPAIRLYDLSGIWISLLPNLDENENSFLTAERIKKLTTHLDRAEKHLVYLELKFSLKQLSKMREKLASGSYKYKALEEDVNALVERIEDELESVLILLLTTEEAALFAQKELFGQVVFQRFPKAHEDIHEAGNCYATSRYTACVFHLMRALEYGLRALAKKLKVKLPRPLELEEWGKLLSEIEKQISHLEKSPRTLKREKDLEFYHGAAAQFRHFKNAWRNHTMHSRSSYDKEQAKAVLAHVKEFLQHIATRLKG